MSREIKLKAWDKANNKWLNLISVLISNDGSVMSVQDIDGEIYGPHQVDLVRYTGKSDISGKEIYDKNIAKDEAGTVVQIIWTDHHQWGCTVIKSKTVLSMGKTFPLWHWDNCEKNGYRQLEVIGNIYENPELKGG